MTDHGRSPDRVRSTDPRSSAGTDAGCGFPASHPPGRFQHLIEHIQDAVVEFEMDGKEPIVRGVNPAFVVTFGYEPEEILGASLNAFIVPPWLAGEAATLDDRTAAGKVNYRHVRRETAAGIRDFLYRGVPYETEDGSRRGFAVYTDLTEDRRNRNRIDVLNRVLRHNLRNKVTLVAGSVEALLEQIGGDDPSARSLAENARTGVEELRTLSREAGDLYRIANATVPEDARIDSVPLARSVAGRFGRRYPDASIDLDLPETLVVAATDLLEVALESLVENAIVHNPSDGPRVWIEADRHREEWCTLAVADDGPGIPAHERAVITGESEITALTHGSGLGLWLVAWTVETVGGEVSFEQSRADGSRVVLRLRRLAADG